MKLPSVFYQLLAVSLLISPTLYASTRDAKNSKFELSKQKLFNKTLLSATRKGIIALVKLSLAEGAAVNITNEDGFTPLCLAIDGATDAAQGKDFVLIAKMLISAGADVNLAVPASMDLQNRGITHVPPLFMAALNGPLAPCLIAAGADPAPTASALMAMWKSMGMNMESGGNEGVCKIFFIFTDFLKNPDHFLLQNHDNKQLLNEIFLLCVMAGRTDLVQKLVAYDVDVHFVDRENRSALDWALIMNDSAMINLILRLTSSFVNSSERHALYRDVKYSSFKPAFMTLKSLASVAVQKMSEKNRTTSASEIN